MNGAMQRRGTTSGQCSREEGLNLSDAQGDANLNRYCIVFYVLDR